MSGGAKKAAWIVTASMAAVEALKDQGFARWNYPMRTIHQHAKSKVAAAYQARRSSSALSPSSTAVSGKVMREAKMRKSERNFNRVMDVSCFGPSTVRF
ncbi:uncharacterized protein LOC116007829 [Ipomoea triloba]|uniref:uncharacterized protein LOC116007829 n=1 Tax=Ipomoea triloba TaxID=35885 RepID=UPI00125E53ED|nr:uncharacterized protein LOC116007829 [Ipomoea triloba]GLL38392.1 hypothetical protein DM860_008691 [Ipomoea trifida]